MPAALLLAVLSGACANDGSGGSASGPSSSPGGTAVAPQGTADPRCVPAPREVARSGTTATSVPSVGAGTMALPRGAGTSTSVPTGLVPPPGPATLAGTVTEGACGQPLEAVGIYLYSSASDFVMGTTKTDASGRWAFANIAATSYRIGVVDLAGVYVTAYAPDASDLAGGRAYDAKPGGTSADVKLYTPEALPTPPLSAAGAAGSRRIVVLGDSLVQQTTTIIHSKIDTIGAASVRGISNQRIDQLQPLATKMADLHPTDVVIAAGNNDLRQHLALDDSFHALDQLLGTFKDARCIAVLNVNSHTLDPDFNAQAVRFNARLATTVASRPNIQLVDWDDVVRLLLAPGTDESTWFTDGLHLTEVGAGAYATTMHDALTRCPR